MSKKFFSQGRRKSISTSEWKSVPDGEMFQSRPFVVQPKEGEKSVQKESDLKTQLRRATRFGHNISQIHAVQSQAALGREKLAVQRKVETSAKVIQRAPKQEAKPPKYLYHATPVPNAERIADNGLEPREVGGKKGGLYVCMAATEEGAATLTSLATDIVFRVESAKNGDWFAVPGGNEWRSKKAVGAEGLEWRKKIDKNGPWKKASQYDALPTVERA